MISPLDIQTKEFARGVRGYKEDEVDIFLDALTNDYEAVINENTVLKAQIEELTAKLNDFRSQEGSVVRTLETAQSLMSDIAASAEKRADLLIKNAEIEADNIVKEARLRVNTLKDEENALLDRVDSYKTRFRALLESELKQFISDTESLDKKKIADDNAVRQFNDIVNSVSNMKATLDREIFNDDAFNNAKNNLEDTIVNLRKGL